MRLAACSRGGPEPLPMRSDLQRGRDSGADQQRRGRINRMHCQSAKKLARSSR